MPDGVEPTSTAGPATWKGYSVEERDRRWALVRANAAAAGLDCTLVPLSLDGLALRPVPDEPSATGSDGRYLSQADGAVVILPTSGEIAPIVITERNVRNSWFSETRTSGRGWTEPVVQALQETGMERARIGVVGLQGGAYTHPNAPDGVVVHSAYADLVQRLPEATFTEATDVVGKARYVKSDEEIAALRRAAQMAASAIEALAGEARPGVAEATLYARGMRHLLAAGSEYVPMTLAAGPADALRYKHPSPQPGRVLEPGWLIEADVRAAWGGLIACESQSFIIGALPEAYQGLVALHQDVFSAGLAALAPGNNLHDVGERIRSAGTKAGFGTTFTLRGCGYGNDGPQVISEGNGIARDIRVESGTTWYFRPVVHGANEAARFAWGGTVLVTDAGGTLLSGRAPALISV